MSIFDWVGDRFKDAVHGVENAADWVGDRFNDVTDGIHDLFTDTPDAQAIEMAELVRKVKTGYGSADLHDVAGIVQQQTGEQQKAADGSHELVQSLESAWQGQASDAARASITPLAQSADDASQTLSANGQNLTVQGEQFDRTKASMAEMPDQPPDKSWFTHFNPITTDSERAVDQYNQLASQNREIFNGYHSSTQGVQGSTQIDYGTLPDAQNAGVGGFQLGPGQTQNNVNSTHVTPQSHTTTSMPTQRRSDSQSSVGVANPSGGINSGINTGSTHQAGYTAPSNSNNTSGSLSGNLWDGGNPGLRPDTTRGPSAGGFGPMGGFSGGFGPGGSGYGGSTTGGGRFGSGTGTGSGGAGAGEGTGSGARAGGGESGRGAMTGGRSAAAGEPGGARAGMAESARGATGGRGASGMGGMGGAGKGQGGDDEEHQRPSYLMEEEPESLFGTDEKTVPPVIGE